MKRAVVLVSGGMDSTTLLWKVAFSGVDDILALSILYGSTHEIAELKAAENVVQKLAEVSEPLGFGLEHRIVDLPPCIFRGGSSALLGEAPMPSEEYLNLDIEGPSPTVVPFRNAVFLSTAAAIADAHNYQAIFIGNHATDYDRWAYPDCSPEFVGAMSNAIWVGTMGKVRLHSPFLDMTKGDLVRLAADLQAPLQLTWSCYAGDVEKGACGECPTCLERLKAFHSAGYYDPIVYANEETSQTYQEDLIPFPTVERRSHDSIKPRYCPENDQTA